MKLAKLRNVVNRKAPIIKEIMNKVDALEACESTCHECTLKYEVEISKKEYKVVEKKELIMKKDMEHKEIMRKNENKPKVFHNRKVIYENAFKVNNELKLIVEWQGDDIKHLKEQWDIDDIDEV